MKKIFEEFRIYIIGLVFLLVIILLAFFSPEKTLFLVDKPVEELSLEWRVISNEYIHENIQLPFRFERSEKNASFKATTVLPDDFPNGRSILVRASMQDLSVYVDNKEIYRDQRERNTFLVYPEVSMWHIIDLPEQIAGRELTLSYYSPIEIFQGEINEVYFGTGDALLNYTIEKHIVGLIVAGFMMLIGIIAIIGSILLKHVGGHRLFYLGVFSLTSSIWMISELRVLQWITGNRFILGGISYLMITLFPIALLKYLEGAVLSAYKKMINRFVFIFGFLFWGTLGLQLLGIMAFIESATVVNAFMAIAIVWIGIAMGYEGFIKKNALAKHYFMYYSVLLTTGFIEIIFFFNQDFDRLTQYDKIGFGLFLVFQFIETLRYVKNLMIIQNEAAYLEQMAYQDGLTKAMNRAAYEKELDRLLVPENEEEFRLILVDINQLKYINDNFGHNVGDEAIISCYECLTMAFGALGTCYRLGGDEFACLLTDTDSYRFKKAKEHFFRLIQAVDARFKFPYSVALGDKLYQRSNLKEPDKFGEFFHDVDGQMYEMKKKMKV